MLTTQGQSFNFKTITVNLVPASIASLATAGLLIFAFTKTEWTVSEPIEHSDTVHSFGMMLMGDYVLPFILVGFLLLVAIIGAIVMATRLSTEIENQSN